ncbi:MULTISPECIES: NADH-quinone oxidoreductase subunit NuoI [Nitrosomonas]|uniref:NADH-quinone oxidoreductase subunit I n=1 Tax=Nitrosomonas communis TaxID=44574 RepID=A0A0F7KFA7_9PROT|nr:MULTISPECIES: NADH-quinone oxidoreductase subunit NuoI [Nitrosomonas]AKH39130.1 NADH dehydrogenase [Nitrosomonas communis]TYP91271.1 NADH-quinone oxidoreductase subunit I [Nitrosomonas communis]UVS61305.1 NADH-quinone oxidoreductase subunit NuoI [Nitrosomonas sp. PLL12]
MNKQTPALLIRLWHSLWTTLRHAWAKRETVSYPEIKRPLPGRWRGRIVLTRDPDGEERCVACYLCSAVCPVDCIHLQATQRDDGRRYPETFRIDFSRCIFCGFCEEACPTLAIQLTPDFEMCEQSHGELVYEKEQLLVEGQGKHPSYNFYRHAGIAITGKAIGEGVGDTPPVDHDTNLP